MYKFYVIGNPISHSKSPLLFANIFKILNINAVYKPLLIKNSHNYKTFIQDIHNTNILGFNITMPYKILANEYIQTVEQKAQIIQSINCVHIKNNQLIGYNNDYIGFEKMMNYNKIKIDNKHNIIIGSGGTARSIILSLINNNAHTISILSRNEKTAKKIISDYSQYKQNTVLQLFQKKCNYNNVNLINCTPIGLIGKNNIEILKSIPKIHYNNIIDVNYNTNNNYFNFTSNKKIDGSDMLLFQALESLDIWFESNISNKLNYSELKKIIC